MRPLFSLPFCLGLMLTCLVWSPQAHSQDALAPAPTIPEWDLKSLFKTPDIFDTEDCQKPGVRSIYYSGLEYQGKPTRVFAYIGLPDVPKGTKVPGIVLVHGGGGTAFDSWVRLWNSRGYAAIAMDNCGGLPEREEPKRWKRHAHSGPAGWGGWGQMENAPTDQWTYHAVADVILAHSVLRSLPEVDVDRIGLTGISWGGYLTCLTAGLDSRFKFAVPVYGCGFTDEHGFAAQVKSLGPEGSRRWMEWWDPSRTLPKAKMPILWVNGSNDFAYTLNAWQKSYWLPPGKRTLCARLRMPHGHGPAGEGPKEIHVFADSIVNGGTPLAKVNFRGRSDQTVWATFDSAVPVTKAELNYTTHTGRWQDREWKSIPATIECQKITATLPEETTVFYFNLFDSRDCVTSTEHQELGPQ